MSKTTDYVIETMNGKIEDPCLNCHDMVLYPDETCPNCGRQEEEPKPQLSRMSGWLPPTRTWQEPGEPGFDLIQRKNK